MVTFATTLYSLLLGDQDTSAPYHLKPGYSAKAIDMLIGDKSSGGVNVGGVGYYSSEDAVGLTKYAVYDGDVVPTPDGNYYMVMHVTRIYRGDTFLFNKCDLKQLLTFTPPYGGHYGYDDLYYDSRYYLHGQFVT